jgi:hypothetical protein
VKFGIDITFQSENLKGRHQLRGLAIDGGTALKLSLKK